MHATPRRSVLAAGLGAGLTALLLTASVVGPSATAQAVTGTELSGDAALARDWLIGQLRPDGTMPASFGQGADLGLSVDSLWALEATGASDATVRHTWSALSTPAAVSAFTGPGFYTSIGMPQARFGGQSAKLLLAAATVGADVADVGGRDLRRQTLDLVAPGGAQKGRIRDVGTGSDNTNIISQSLGVMGLSVTGSVPPDTVTFLLSQQCSRGYFRLYDNDDRSCDAAAPADATADNDGTAFGVQALIAAKAAGGAVPQAAIDRGVSYLASVQRPDGSFGGGVGTQGSNTNSTGLAAAALQAGGDVAAAARAGAWVASLEATGVDAAGTPLAGDLGAIAYDPSAWAQGLRGGIGAGGDQWRRATAQAVFALSPRTLASLAGAGPGPGPGPTSTPGPTSSSPASSTTGTATPTETATQTGSTTRTGSTTQTGSTTPTGSTSSRTRTAAPRTTRTTSQVGQTQPTGPTAARPGSSGPAATGATAGSADRAGTISTATSARARATGTASGAAAKASTASTRRTGPSSTAPGTTGASTAGASTAGALTEAGGQAVARPALPRATRIRGHAQRWLGLPPVLWAVLAGLLLGAVAVVRPWQLLPRGRHER